MQLGSAEFTNAIAYVSLLVSIHSDINLLRDSGAGSGSKVARMKCNEIRGRVVPEPGFRFAPSRLQSKRGWVSLRSTHPTCGQQFLHHLLRLRRITTTEKIRVVEDVVQVV